MHMTVRSRRSTLNLGRTLRAAEVYREISAAGDEVLLDTEHVWSVSSSTSPNP